MTLPIAVGPPVVRPPAGIRLPVADIVVVGGVVVFGTDILEVSLRGGGLERFIGLVYVAFYAAGLMLAILSRALPRALLGNPLLALLLLLPLLSALWSVDRDMTLYRNIMLLGTSLFGLFIGWHYTPARLLRLLGIGIAGNFLLSMTLILALPSLGVDSSEAWAGAWLGAHLHKNGFGAAVGMGLLILFYAAAMARGPLRLGFWLAFALGVLLLLGSRSTTALIVTSLGLVLALWLWLWRRARGLAWAMLVAAALFLPLLGLVAGQHDLAAIALIGLEKDLTVHGRTDIWRLVWPYITDRVWLGYGYGAFWQPGLAWFSQLEARLHYTPHYAHNGIIELWLAGGVVTVATALALYLATLARAAVLAMRRGAGPEAAFALVFLTSFALRNVTEAALLQGNDFIWLLFVAVAVMTARAVSLRLRPWRAAPAVLPAPGLMRPGSMGKVVA